MHVPAQVPRGNFKAVAHTSRTATVIYHLHLESNGWFRVISVQQGTLEVRVNE